MSTPAMPVPAPSAESSSALSEGERLINVFIAPSKTFTDLKRKASWFVPWLVMAIASVTLVAVVGQKVGFRQVTENQMHMEGSKAQERMAEMPADQRERITNARTIGTRIFSYAFPLLLLLIWLVYAGILMGTFNFGMGEELSFGTCLAVVIYAQLPASIRALLAIVSLYAGADPEGFTFQNPVASNLGFLVDANAHPALYALASSADIFIIWTIILTGIGFSCVSKIKRSTAIGTVFAWYVLFTAVVVGITAIFR